VAAVSIDHPDLENFPHHVHISSERDLVPGYPLSLVDLLKVIESELPQL